MGMIVLAVVCGILANELFAWGPCLSDLLLKLAVNRMTPRLRERMREEWRAHLDVLPGGLSKLSAAAGFLLSTFWGFRRYREDETPIEIEDRIALAVGVALEEERERLRNALERRRTEVEAGFVASQLAVEKMEKEIEKKWRENRTQLVKRRTHARSSAPLPPNRYKTTRHKGRPEFRARSRAGRRARAPARCRSWSRATRPRSSGSGR
jgi:hypothetical protein